MLESAGTSCTFFGFEFDAYNAADGRENFADVILSALIRYIVDKQVRLEELFHVLMDRSPALVRIHVIFSFCYMRAHQQKVAINLLLFVHLGDCVLGALRFGKADKTTVFHVVNAISMLHKSRGDLSKGRK